MPMGRGDRLVVAASIALALSLVWVVPGRVFDFVWDWLLARTIVEGGNPYLTIGELVLAQGWPSPLLDWPHPRTPGILVLQLPLALIPEAIGYLAGRILVIFSAFALAWVMSKLTRWSFPQLAPWVPATLLVWPFSDVLLYGQTGFLLAVLIGLGWWLLLQDKEVWAGVPLGIAVLLKLFPWLIPAALFVSGKWKTAVSAGVTFVGLNMIGLAFPNIALADAIEAVSRAARFVDDLNNISLVALLDLPIWLGWLTGVLFLLAMTRAEWETALALSIPVSLLIAPIVWAAYLPILAVPILVYADRLTDGVRLGRDRSAARTRQEGP